ncbi:MAG: hypothetical protein MRY64_10250 [Hyphomonadaceae bacterium]|nr:hypothetical protein [Hyphomonadaceae bacterium]
MAKRADPIRRRQAWDVPPLWLVIGGGLAIILAWIGWMIGLPAEVIGLARAEEAFYRALTVNTLSDAYTRPFDGAGERSILAVPMLLLARWIGVAVFFLTLLKVVIRLFLQSILAWWCRTRWRDHIVIIGDRPFAYSIAESAADARLKVVHFTPGGSETTRNGILSLDSNHDLPSLLEQGAAHRARSLVFALEDNAESADMARWTFHSEAFEARARAHAGQSASGDAEHQGPHIYVSVDDGWFEHREELDYGFDRPAEDAHLKDSGVLDSVVELISESRCAARAVLAAHPLYAMGEAHLQHILLVGFGAMGQALLTEICETQRTDPYRKQVISIIDPDAASWLRFQRRCPEWHEVFEGHFYPAQLDREDDALADLFARMDTAPVTAAFVTPGEDMDPAIAAAQLKQLIRWEMDEGRLARERLGFPIFTCVRGGGTSQNSLQDARPGDGQMPIQAFGTWDEIVAASRILEREPDAAAYRVHSVHNSLWSGTPPTNWSQVPEVHRYSSRSAAAYVPTLLHAAGFDLQPWIAEAAPNPPSSNLLPSLAEDSALAEDLTERVLLARLEHIRWCAERRLRGFRHASRRDDGAKRHPDLVAFDDLPLKSRAYNLNYILALSDRLAAEGGLVTIAPREGARRALVRPTDLALLREVGMLTLPEADPETEPSHAEV